MTPTWKRFYFSRRHPSLTLEQFPLRWRQHAELGATFPDGMKRHTRLNYALIDPAHSATGARQYDGIGILWLGSPAMLDYVNQDPNCTPTMRADELHVFTQPVYDSAMVAEEHVFQPGPLTKHVLLRFIRRKPGVDDTAFGRACEPLPAPAGVQRRAWGTTVRPPTIDFDAFLECWFDTREEAIAARSDAVFKALDIVTEDAASYVALICHKRVTPPLVTA